MCKKIGFGIDRGGTFTDFFGTLLLMGSRFLKSFNLSGLS